MKIYIGSDHAGFELKDKLTAWLMEQGHEVQDLGAHELNPSDDYPDFIEPVARAVASDPERSRGIVLGGSGQGEAIDANRFSGVRAAEFYGGDLNIVKLAREHNDANVLSLGARFIDDSLATEAVKVFLDTPFSGDERHIRRIHKLDN